MGALIDIIMDICSIIVDLSGDLLSFIKEFVTTVYDVIGENPLMGVLLLLLLIKIIKNIKELV